MNDFVQSWLEQASVLPGVLACAVRRADRTILVWSGDSQISEASLVDVMQNLAETLHLLQQHRLTGSLFCWNFEHHQLHYAIGTDGSIAAVAAHKEEEATVVCERALVDFLQPAG